MAAVGSVGMGMLTLLRDGLGVGQAAVSLDGFLSSHQSGDAGGVDGLKHTLGSSRLHSFDVVQDHFTNKVAPAGDSGSAVGR